MGSGRRKQTTWMRQSGSDRRRCWDSFWGLYPCGCQAGEETDHEACSEGSRQGVIGGFLCTGQLFPVGGQEHVSGSPELAIPACAFPV